MGWICHHRSDHVARSCDLVLTHLLLESIFVGTVLYHGLQGGRGRGRRTYLAWKGWKIGRARFSSPASKIFLSSKCRRFESPRLAVLKSVSGVVTLEVQRG